MSYAAAADFLREHGRKYTSDEDGRMPIADVIRIMDDYATDPFSTTVIDMCDQGHRFAKLPDHPMRDGRPRCPHCLAQFWDRITARQHTGDCSWVVNQTWCDCGMEIEGLAQDHEEFKRNVCITLHNVRRAIIAQHMQTGCKRHTNDAIHRLTTFIEMHGMQEYPSPRVSDHSGGQSPVASRDGTHDERGAATQQTPKENLPSPPPTVQP